MNAPENTTTGLNWDGGDGHWSATGADGTVYTAIRQAGTSVLWVGDVCRYDKYYFLADAMAEAETLDAAPPAPAITRADLDWLCVTQRAAENDTDSVILWDAAVEAMHGLIARFNTAARDEAHAAHAQFLIGRLAAFAITPVDGPTVSGVPVPLVSERMKDRLMHLASGGYDALAILL
jgi:hypothetical protein